MGGIDDRMAGVFHGAAPEISMSEQERRLVWFTPDITSPVGGHIDEIDTPSAAPLGDEARLREIAQRCEKATPGPWRLVGARDPEHFVEGAVACRTDDPEFDSRILAQPNWNFEHRADMAFTAHARDDVPWLLAQLTAARAECAADRERLDWLEQRLNDPRCIDVAGNPPAGLREHNEWWIHLNGIGYVANERTLREAIDAARATDRR